MCVRVVSRWSLVVLCLLGQAAGGAARSTPARPYDVTYTARLIPGKGIAAVTIDVVQIRGRLGVLDLSMPRARYSNVAGDGKIRVDGDRVHWSLPELGGALSFDYKIDHRRTSGAYDARITKDWTLVRLDDIFPSSRTEARKGARSRTRLVIDAPAGWSIETPYGRYRGKPLEVRDDRRAFDRPKGWLIAGKLGVRRTTLADRHIAIAAPIGHGVRRMDLMALFTWTMPTLVKIFPKCPERILMVSAADEMWRGGLSGPGSFYVHASRPLLSENGTSTILHELVHVASGLHGADGGDWIVEGIAEYYSLEVLRRTGTITQRQFGRAIADLGAWSEDASGLATDRATGATTARAVGVLHDLDLEIREASGSRWTLDRVVGDLVDAGRPVTLAALAAAAEKRMGRTSKVLTAAP